jgi:NAD+ kinase
VQVLVRYFEYLEYAHIPFCIYLPYLQELAQRFPLLFSPSRFETFSHNLDLKEVKFLLSFGGDGTVLECVRMLGNSPTKIPILGVNFGRLGYLTSITQQDLIPATHLLERDIYKIDPRGLMDVVSDPPGIFKDKNFGLNDLTIHKSNTNEMITVHVYVNGEFLNSYRGDGLIIATPTGSTAYSLACGGPILFPASQNFIITPVAPHSLTVRPVVVPDSWVISCQVESRSGQAMTALDTRTELIKAGTSLAIRKAAFSAALVRLPENKYISTLRRTLMWGSDARK